MVEEMLSRLVEKDLTLIDERYRSENTWSKFSNCQSVDFQIGSSSNESEVFSLGPLTTKLSPQPLHS
jgi:hypothetical protein